MPTGRDTASASDAGPAPLVVLVPDQAGIEALAAVPAVRGLRYRPDGELPVGGRTAAILVVRGLDPAGAATLVGQLPQLEVVQLFSSGTDHWQGRFPDSVTVSNLSGVHGGAVAEWVVAQLLGHYRRLADYRDQQLQRQWQVHRTGSLMGKQVLVFGAGDIGENLRSRLEPFGATVTLVGSTPRGRILGPEQGRALLGESDVVVLALPASPSTRGMVDSGFLAGMRDGAVLVNAGRGQLVDTEALLNETNSRRLQVFLDVTEPEPLPPEHPLWDAPGVVITPHAAGITDDLDDRCWSAIAAKVAAFAAEIIARPEP